MVIARRWRWSVALLIMLSLLTMLTLTPKVALADPPATPPGQLKKVCADKGPDQARCHAVRRTDTAVATPDLTTAPSGYAPADLQAAYGLPSSTAGTGQTVAIVDAYDNPNAESDLATYRAQYGLPPCTTANGCFRKVDQNGGTAYPAGDVGWGQEIALDLDMVSAICPNCKILLVEANSSSFDDLGLAVNRAVTLGANAVSNSYGANEWNGATYYDIYYNHPGVAITASTGDSGYGVQYPAASTYVTAVGGTSLNRTATTRGWSEGAWSGAGSGCSAYIAKPGWQQDGGCARRTVADVSAVADPYTGVAIYDSYCTSTSGCNWQVFGGTSVASPVIAGVYALGGHTSSVTSGSYPYGQTAALYDVTSGSNGSCNSSYLCTAVAGFDGPTGLGTPNGTVAFGGVAAPKADFTLAASPATVAVAKGGTATSTVTVGAVNGYTAPVQLAVTGLPRQTSATLSPNTVTPSGAATLRIAAGKSARPGTYTLTITGTGTDGTKHIITMTLTIQ